MSTLRKLIFSVLTLLAAIRPLSAQDISGGMLDPAMDPPDKPFCYFANPTDVIGAWLAPVASEVTPEGYIYTGCGELMFFVGNPAEPIRVRHRTLRDGYLPIVEYQLVRHGVRYRFTLFASDLGGSLEGLPVNFAQVDIANEAGEQRAAFFSTAYRFAAPSTRLTVAGDYRFGQRFDLMPARLTKDQTSFRQTWIYSFTKDSLTRDGRLLYQFPTTPQPQVAALALNEAGIRAVRFLSGKVLEYPAKSQAHNPQLPMGFVMYRLILQPGERQQLLFKMPIVPLPLDGPEAQLVRQADGRKELDKVVAQWTALVGRRNPLRLPERKVQEYLLANTTTQLLAIDKIGDDWVMNVNKFQYHRYYVGNAASMDIALDMVGQEEAARRCLLYARKMQFPDGNFGLPGRKEQWWWEMTGYALWAWGRHWELTRDCAFLDEVYPGVVAGVEWIKRTRRSDPAGLLPPVEIVDDAMLAGIHQTGQQVWNLIGLKGAIRLAQAAGKPDDARAFQAEFDDFWKVFEKALNAKLKTTGGVITSALDGDSWGNHWDNLLMLYPEQLFEPFDPRVTATIRQSRSTYVEGLLPFLLPRAVAKRGAPDWPDTERAGLPTVDAQGVLFNAAPSIHYWQTPNNAQNALVRGTAEDQQAAVADLYALLVHTSSTHAPQEFGTVPWGTRDFGEGSHNLLPDGAASAKTIELLRNMLIRESGEDLYLLSAVSPEWLRPGKEIAATKAPTNFGPITFTLKAAADSVHLSLSAPTRNQPRRILVRIPWFFDLASATADGKPATIESGHIVLTSATRQVTLTGRIKPAAPRLSYEQAVSDYKAEYRRRYEEFLRTGLK
ncbi:MAG: hypothetical protein N2689_13125 [Verrucomicrobiae bacterium]|nr:hypothetical protein [Verrucomicrobiae bacterium]